MFPSFFLFLLVGVVKANQLTDESFRRLESGENSEEIVNQCCSRQEKFVAIGDGVDGTEIRVDVGECRKVCRENFPLRQHLKREEFDKYLKKYPNVDPLQIFLTLQSRDDTKNISLSLKEEDYNSSSRPPISSSSSSCISSKCLPTSSRMDKHFGLGGKQYEIEVIDHCDCAKVPSSCQKVSKSVKVHVGTPFETVVDMGACLGSCGDSLESSCRSVRNRSVSVEGPNGAQCHQVVEECECTGNCYRIKEHLKVFDYSSSFSSSTTNSSDIFSDNIIPGNDKQPSMPLTKVIDIGRCGGSCDTISTSVTSKCLYWSNGKCVSSLEGGRSLCSPTKFMTHSYTTKKGQRHTIYSVLSCGCH